jgi:pantoate--beta-alanine ligase
VGLVPTMGALHPGHLALLAKARRHCDRLVVSLYVNPTQFGPSEDLERYPRPFQEDLRLCRRHCVDVLFAPKSLYAPDHSTWVVEEAISQDRCGRFRPGHFRGVATVVVKLFGIVLPDVAVFGEKDYQQLELVRRLVRDLFLPVKVLSVPVIRDWDGLAWSSRNRYLSTEQRRIAADFARILKQASFQEKPACWAQEKLERLPGLRVEYVEYVRGRLCAAVWIGTTRLIDNVRCQRTAEAS